MQRFGLGGGMCSIYWVHLVPPVPRKENECEKQYKLDKSPAEPTVQETSHMCVRSRQVDLDTERYE